MDSHSQDWGSSEGTKMIVMTYELPVVVEGGRH